MAIDPRLKRKIRAFVCIKDRGVRQLVKSVFLHEAGYTNTTEIENFKDAHEKLAAGLKAGLPIVTLIDNHDTWKNTFAFIDKIRTTEETKGAEFILLADGDNDPVIDAEVQQRRLGKLLPKPFSRAEFHKALDSIVGQLRIPVQTANIMIVDDDRDFCTMLRQDYLEPSGFKNITVCNSYDEAMRLLNTTHGRVEQIDLILSDVKMPSHSGLDLLKRVRADQRWEQTPFLLISGGADKAMVVESLKNKVTEFMVKPITAKTLLEKISKYLPWFTPSAS